MEGGPLLTDWWIESSKDFIPYLNITAQWDGAPDQGLLRPKGGRGFPYCTIMDASGEVVWEVRPTSKEALDEAFANATQLVSWREKLAKTPDDAAISANVALLDALGRQQREAPSVADLDKHAQAKGVDPNLRKRFDAWRGEKIIQQAMNAAREDGGKAVYELYKAGTTLAAGNRMELSFLMAAARGAIAAKDKETATKAVDALEKVTGQNERVQARMKEEAAKMRAQIAEL